MPTTGPNNASTIAVASSLDFSWTSETEFLTSNDTYAIATGTISTSESDVLRFTGFGFSIPADATINGVLVEIEGYVSGGTGKISSNRLALSGVGIGTKKANVAVPTSEAYTSFGGAADLWGATLTANDVNNSTFGVQFGVLVDTAIAIFRMDHVRMSITYTAAAGGTVTVTRRTPRGLQVRRTGRSFNVN